MKKLMVIVGILFLCGFPINSCEAQDEKVTKSSGVLTSAKVTEEVSKMKGLVITVGKYGAKLYEKPNSTEVLGKILGGAKLEILEDKIIENTLDANLDKVWFKVEYEEDVGWINENVLKKAD